MLLKSNIFIEWKISYIGPLKVPCWSWTLEPLGEPQGTSTGVCRLGACRISCSVLEKIWHLNWWSTKKSHSLFLAFGFLRGVTHFYGITFAMTYDFSRISKNNIETSAKYFQRHFFNHPAWFFSVRWVTLATAQA